jgi:hypothetical protein
MMGELLPTIPTPFFSFSPISPVRKSAMLAHPGMGNSIFGTHMVFSLARLGKFF